ncbi:MAG: FAD-dependent oxidoreductase [Bryobacterales bacterium]|nr:FAD-dependent oxidoreductase [Bryobacterales bacterium]
MHLVVIGGVAAGMSAASRARRLDRDAQITVLERSSVVSYGACGLPYWISGVVDDAEELIVHPPEFFERERGIRVRTNTRVAEVAPARRRVLLEGGEELLYDRLVIATGARPVALPVPGAELPHCFRFHTWDDAHRLDAFLREQRPASAAIVGAGFVGLEMAEALLARGLRVTLFDQASHFLGWRDEWLSERIQNLLRTAGVELRLGRAVREIGSKEVDGVPADVVILSPGIAPNTELASAAGITLGRRGAIVVNEFLETNISGIFAAGDCAETFHLLLNAPSWIALGTTANKMGRVAGANAIGRKERFPGVVGTSILRVCGLAVGVTGLSELSAREAGFRPVTAAVEARNRPSYFGGKQVSVKLVVDSASGRLLGGAVTGEEGVEGRVNVLATAITAGLRAEEFQFADLCYSPPYATVWDPLLIAAQQAMHKLG